MAVRIEGHREVRRRIRQISDDLDQKAAKGELKAINQRAAEIVAGRAEQLVPVQSGRLRDTIRAAGTQKSGRVRAGFKRVPYAGPIHFGWAARGIVPQPFLYQALDQRRLEVFLHYDQQLESWFKKHGLD